MKAFDYSRAHTVGDAIREAHGNTRFLAGGTNLIDLMKYRVEDADHLIDITHLPLGKIEESPQGLTIGALVRNSDLAEDARVKAGWPVLSEALLAGASPQLRNMATLGGNLMQRTRCYYFYDTALPCNKRQPGSGCGALTGINRIHAILGQSDQCIAVNPSDMSVALAALGATVLVQGPGGQRTIPILDFHRLPGTTPEVDTNLKPGELILSVHLPASGIAKRSHYLKVRDRAQFAFALASAAVALDLDRSNIKEARIALGGVAHKPWRAENAEAFLAGKSPTEDVFRQAAEIALQGATAYKHNQFKIELAKRTLVRALSEIGGLR